MLAESASFENAIEPANCAFVIVPTKALVAYPVASCKSNAGVASEAPRASETPPNETVLFANFAFAIEPANCAFVIVPVSEEVG